MPQPEPSTPATPPLSEKPSLRTKSEISGLASLQPRTLAHILLLLTAMVWGSTFVLVKAALADSTPLLMNFIRMVIASAALALVNRRQLRAVTRKQLLAGIFTGLLLAGGYQFQTVGLSLTTPVKSAFITGMVVVLVPLFTVIPAIRPADAPRPGWFTGIGVLTAFAGLIYLTTPPGTTARTLVSAVGIGDFLTLLCAVAFALHLLTLAHTSRFMSAGLLATLQIAACTLFMLLSLPLEHPHATFTPRLIVTLLLTGLLCTAAAFTIQSYAQQHLPPTHTVLLLSLEPVFAWLTGLALLHQTLGRRALLGAVLILAGILIIELLPATHTTEIPA